MDATIKLSFRKSYFHMSYRRRMQDKLARQWPASVTQTDEMATLLNSLFFVLTNLFLPSYCVKKYDYIVKCSSGVACSWCLSLVIALILALKNYHKSWCVTLSCVLQ